MYNYEIAKEIIVMVTFYIYIGLSAMGFFFIAYNVIDLLIFCFKEIKKRLTKKDQDQEY